MIADIASALGSDDVFGDAVPTAMDMATEAEEPRAIRILEFHSVMIEDFAVVQTLADFATAHALSADGVALFDPVNDIQIVDVLLDDMVAANPGEVIPVAHLVFHFGEL